ncbi:MAG: TolC family protein [Candidatus Omnitrophota bacterium]
METQVYHQVKESQDLLIDIGAAQKKIAQWRTLLYALEKTKEAMTARESGGFSYGMEKERIETSINNVKAEILSLQEKEKSWTVALNSHMGQSNTNLHKAIPAALSWEKPFVALGENTEEKFRETLIGEGSPNSRMKEASAADTAAEMTVRLQGLKKLPVVNLSGLYVSGKDNPNSIYDLLPGAVEHSSALTPGLNSIGQIEIPLWDSVANTQAKIMALEKEKAKLYVEQTKADLIQELEQTINRIKILSEQIEQAKEGYRGVYRSLESKAKRPDVYLPSQLIQERFEMEKWQQKLVDLKAQYLKEESALRAMGLLGEEKAPTLAGIVENSQASTVAGQVSQTNTHQGTFNQQVGPQGELMVGTVNYHIGGDVTGAWALMHNDSSGSNTGSLEIMKQMLINDPNVFVRTDALHHFLAEYQDNNEFILTLKYVLLHSTHSDVIYELLKFMGQREDHGLRFFVQIIHDAHTFKHQALVDLSFQFLRDVFTMYPEVIQGLTQADFVTDSSGIHAQVSPQLADKVFLTFLAREPDDSIAKVRFLQSDFWGINDLARIYTHLTNYINTYPGTPNIGQTKKLTEFIYNSILQKEALGNVDETFRLGGFEQLGKIVLDQDIMTVVKIREMKEANREFLYHSVQGQSMEGFVHPKLFLDSKKDRDSTLLQRMQTSMDLPIYDLPRAPNQYSELAYFKSLGLDGQKEYVAKSRDICELTRLLQLQTPLRTVILDRLMTNPEGRLLVFKTYLDSSDIRILELIESRPWMETFKADIKAVKSAADYQVLRLSLEKLYERTHQEWLLNMRLTTYSFVELHSVSDPRGGAVVEAQINVAATKTALKFLDERMQYKPVFWAGQALQSPQEKQELANIRHILTQEIDPIKINAYIEGLVASAGDHKVKAMLQEIISVRDKMAKDIKNNDQSIKKFPVFLKGLAVIVGMFPLGIFLNSLRNRVWLRRASEEDLTKMLYKKLLGDEEGKLGKEELAVIPLPSKVYNSTEDILKNWHSLISRWNQQKDLPVGTILNDLNTILNCAEEVLNDMPFTPDLIWSTKREPPRNDIYKKTFSYFNLLAINTLIILKKRLQVEKLTALQRLKLEDDIDVLRDNIAYSSRFSRILSFRGNIEKVMSYKFPNNDWRERLKLYPLIRKILMYKKLWVRGDNGLREELPLLLKEGNALIDGFYENPQEIVDESFSLLKTVTDRGKTSYDPLSPDESLKFRNRSFNSRLLSFIGLTLTGLTIFGFVVGIPGITFGGVSLLSFFILGIGYFAFWHPHLDILKMQWYRELTLLVNKLSKSLGDKLNPSGVRQTKARDHDSEIVSLAKQEGAQQVQEELDLTHPPSVDMIVVVAQDGENSQNLEQYVDSRRGKLIRNDVPVIVTSSKHEGSGNAYLESVQRVKDIFASPEYKQKYPHLKSWDKSRVMFVFHGKDASRESSIQQPLLDWGITNGYRTAKNGALSDSAEHKSGHILIYSRDAYFGPVPDFPDSGVTMLTSRVNSRNLKAGSLVNAKFTSTGEVRELLEGVDVGSLEGAGRSMPREGKLLNFLKDHFNLNNRSLNQYPVFNGILLVAPDAVDIFKKTAEYIEQNNLWEKLKLSLSSDFLVPMVMGNVYDEQKETEVKEYALKRVRWKDMIGTRSIPGEKEEEIKNIEGLVQNFYSFFNGICGKSIKVNAFLPYSRSEVFVRVGGENAQEEMARFRKVANLAEDHSTSVEPPGGVDLSRTEDAIQFNQKRNDSIADSKNSILSPAMAALKSFQGFEFQVMQYQPILNPIELFMGSSIGKSGTWFSSRSPSTNSDQV